MASSTTSCTLLELPREIRDQILGEVLFPGEKEPQDLTQNNLGLGPTAVRQIHPYNTDKGKKPHFDVAVITTCKQLQQEAESILYGSSSWNLMYQDWWDTEKVSYEFLERFPRRLRRLIQRVERKCYSEPYNATISLWDWKAFMTFLALECPNLHSLRLWGPGDRNEGPPWVETCNKDAEWVRAILQIRSLKYFDIPVITGGNIYEHPKFRDDFLPWLRSSLVQSRKPQSVVDCQAIEAHDSSTHFPFLRLERRIRDRIYRHVLLPSDRRLHPYIKSWYDQTPRNAIPLFLASGQIHAEAECVLYGSAIFTSPCLAKYDRGLSRFLGGKIRQPGSGLHPRLLRLIKHLSFGWSKVGQMRVFDIIGRGSMQLDHLEFVLSEKGVKYMNDEWRERAINPRALWRAGYAKDSIMKIYARIPRLVVRTPPGGPDLEPECRQWWTCGLRNELLNPSGDAKLAWLHDDTRRLERGEDPYADSGSGYGSDTTTDTGGSGDEPFF